MKKSTPNTKDGFIANLLMEGCTYSFIADKLKTGHSRIARVASQLKQNQEITSPKMGRPPKVTSSVVQMVENETLNDPRIGGTALSHIITHSLGITLSATTINLIRNNLKFSFTNPRRRPFMTEKNIENRLIFCNSELNGTIDWEEGVVFSDESRFCVRDDSRRIWIKKGIYNDNTFVSEKKYNRGIMVWGAIGYGWRSPLVLIKGTLNSDGYINMLQDNEIFSSLNEKYGEKGYYFEQDGASCHRSKKTKDWLKTQNINSIDNWPANSPDLSCIEQVWAILETKIQKYKINSLEELYSSLQKEWYLIPEEKLNNLIRTTPQRFKLCINENGKSIGHKLYTLKKKENEDFQYIFSQNDNMNDQESPILKIPIQNIDFTFCEQIAQKLIQNDQIHTY